MLAKRDRNTVFAALLGVFCLELIRTAWISDDAAITLRTVLNFIHGYGPTFNIDERVQAYTHPLWFFLISGLSVIVGNVFTVTFALSIGLSLVALWLFLTRLASDPVGGAVAGAGLLLSKAYLDFSTSGLENPLSHVLVLVAILLALRARSEAGKGDLAPFFFTCALIYLNRPDLLGLMLPLAVLLAATQRRQPARLVRAVLIGALPLLAWSAFSTFYYGFPFPNTAYAKLGTGIPLDERFVQGLRYLLHSVGSDPLTIAFIAGGVAVGFFGSAISISLSCGVALYLLYVLSIGGDFMEGRFLTAPMLVAAVVFARSTLSRAQWAAIGSVIAILGAVNVKATLLSDASYKNQVIAPTGIADERGFYYQKHGLLTAPKSAFSVPQWTVGARKVAVICGGLGYQGIYDGPGMHYIDECALADPLLARLPARHDPNWRIGHFVRQLPTDYRESIEQNRNALSDPQTRDFYEALRRITRSPLADPERLKEIVRFNLGKVARPDPDLYRYRSVPASSGVVVARAEQLNKPTAGGAWDAPGNIRFGRALEVQLASPASFSEIDVSVDNNDTYTLEVREAGAWREVGRIAPSGGVGMARHQVRLQQPAAGATAVRLTADGGDGLYSLGHVLLK
jgi:arabinofuranosyltransferase